MNPFQLVWLQPKTAGAAGTSTPRLTATFHYFFFFFLDENMFRTTFPWANLLGTKKDLKKFDSQKYWLREFTNVCLLGLTKHSHFVNFEEDLIFFFLLFLKMFKCNILQNVQSTLVWKCQVIQLISHWAHTCSDVSKTKKWDQYQINIFGLVDNMPFQSSGPAESNLLALKQATPNHFFFLFFNSTLC